MGIEAFWVATNSDPTRGLVIIKIPKQDSGVKPFLITKTLDGPKQVETVFGFAQRKGDKNPPLEVKDLQRILRSGIHYQEKIDEQLTSIMSLIRESIEHSSGPAVHQVKTELIEAHIGKAIEHNNLKDERVFIIAAQPLQHGELKTIFVGEPGSIKFTLEHPPALRVHPESSHWIA